VAHVVPDEAERMHRDETVEHALRLIVPVIGTVERNRQAHLFEQRIGLHVLVGMDRAIPGGCDEKSDHALLVAELLHERIGRVGIVERQIEHRDEPRLVRQPARAEPAGGGARERAIWTSTCGCTPSASIGVGNSTATSTPTASIQRLVSAASRWPLPAGAFSNTRWPERGVRPPMSW